MKDLDKPKYRSLLQLGHLHSYIMVYYIVYPEYIGEIHVDKSYPSVTLMAIRSLDVEKDLFRPKDDGNKLLRLNVS